MSTKTDIDHRGREALFREAMQRAQAGDAAAYRELLGALRVILLAYVRGILQRMGKADPATVEDLVQEVLLAIHEKRHTWDAGQPFLPWFFAVTRYKVIDYGRRLKRHGQSVPLETVEGRLAAPVFSDPGVQQDLQSLLSELPERSRRALELVKLEGLSVAEAASKTRMSPGALKVVVHRAIRKLRQDGKGK